MSLIQSFFIFFECIKFKILATAIRNSRRKPEGRRWSFKEEALALSIFKCSPKSYTSSHCSFTFQMNLTDHSQHCSFQNSNQCPCVNTLKCTLQTIFDGDCVSFVMFDAVSIRENCLSVRSLAVLRALRTMEDTTGQGIWKSCPVLHAPWSL